MSDSVSEMDTKALQLFLNEDISSFKRSDWIGKLVVPNIAIYDDEKGTMSIAGTIDICQYLPGGLNHSNIDPTITQLRFDSSHFPPSESQKTAFDSGNPTYKKLRAELQRAAIQCGYSLVPKSGARFVCKCGRTYANATSKKKSTEADIIVLQEGASGEGKENEDPCLSLRKFSWQYDSKNTRKKGLDPLPRNTTTCLPINLEETCKFAIKLYHDSKGYFVSPKYGCAIHSQHSFIEATNNLYSLNLVEGTLKSELGKLSNAKLGAAHGRNYVFANEPNIYLSKSQIRYAFRHADASSLGTVVANLKMGSDGLINFFNSRDDIYYCIWGGNNVNDKKRHASDATFQSNLLFNACYRDGEEEIISLDTLCADVVEFYHKEKTILLDPTNNQKMFIACAWCSKSGRRMFQLNPFVMKVDATCHTNNEKRHLLTFTSKSVGAKSFTFLNVYLPDQKASTFRWVFQVALPKLIGKKTAERVQYAMTDGDSHEFSELDKAIKKYFVNAVRGRCGWHIINKGWKRYGISETDAATPDQEFALKQALNTTLNWLYMFCKPGGCEDEEEYAVSKSLLLAYVHNHVAKAIGGDSDRQKVHVTKVLKFLFNHVFVHEEHFVFYPRKKVLHFDESTNSSHEGTNNGLKSHSAAVLPSMDISTSAQVIQFQTDISMKEMERESCKNTVNTNLQSSLPTASKVNPVLNSIFEQQWSLASNYFIKRNPPNNYEWLVVLKDEFVKLSHNFDHDAKTVNPYNKYIPRFRRIRVVKMNSTGELQCSCCLFSRFGFGCVHILSVILFENPMYNGYTQYDVRVFWWNDYCFYAHKEDRFQNGCVWDRCYMELLDNDIKGPNMPSTWICNDFVPRSNVPESSDTVEDAVFAQKPAVDRLRNYTTGQAKGALRIFANNMQFDLDGSIASFAGAVGYSQLCNVEEESDSDTNFPTFVDTDNRGGTDPSNRTQQYCDARSVLKPLYDKLCGLYESKNAKTNDMPNLDKVVDAINEQIHCVNQYFHGLNKKRIGKQNDKENYVSVCTEKESCRVRCYVSSNGLG